MLWFAHIVVSASAEEPKAAAPIAPANKADGGAEVAETAAPVPAPAPAPAPSGRLTADDQKAMAEALETIQRVSAKALADIHDALKAAHPALETHRGRGGFIKNDYRAYQWIEVRLCQKLLPFRTQTRAH